MRDKIKGKLRSRQGMSLLLALLAFLICAMAGSVLLTAGTASSGTVSERANMDRRYFSVTSAAEFLREKFDGQSVSVTVNHNEITATSTATVKIPRKLNGQHDEYEYVPIKRDENKGWVISSNEEEVSAEEKFVIDQSLSLLSNPDDKDKKWYYSLEYDTLEEIATKWRTKYAITVSDNPELETELKIQLAKRKVSSGNLEVIPRTLEFVVTRDDGNDGKYSLKISYSASVAKDFKITADGEEIDFRVTWKIGAISLAS